MARGESAEVQKEKKGGRGGQKVTWERVRHNKRTQWDKKGGRNRQWGGEREPLGGGGGSHWDGEGGREAEEGREPLGW
jgi:hypothetical protein